MAAVTAGYPGTTLHFHGESEHFFILRSIKAKAWSRVTYNSGFRSRT